MSAKSEQLSKQSRGDVYGHEGVSIITLLDDQRYQQDHWSHDHSHGMVAAFLTGVSVHPSIIAESISEETKLVCFDKTREPIPQKLVELLLP